MMLERAQLEQSYDVGKGGRFELQELALGVLFDHPFGIGPFAFSAIYGNGTQQHNVYLQAFLVYGWLGGVTYISLLAVTLAVGLEKCVGTHALAVLFDRGLRGLCRHRGRKLHHRHRPLAPLLPHPRHDLGAFGRHHQIQTRRAAGISNGKGDGMKHTTDFPVAAKASLALPPRIAINGRFLTQRTSGVQRFASETIKAIDSLLDSEPYRALKGRVEIIAPPKARDFPLKNIPLRRCGWTNGYLWEQVEFPLHAAGALLLNLCMLGPVAVRRQVVVVHDATVKALPGNFSWKFRTAYSLLIPAVCRRAALAVTVSRILAPRDRQTIPRRYVGDAGLQRRRRPHHAQRRPITPPSNASALPAANISSASAPTATTRISACWRRPSRKPSSTIRCWCSPAHAMTRCSEN